ncbi:MAG: hypothetical protein JWL94_1806 [Microbacteriaceae bacterium]|nr:hypothetical protein [Microbacteriaceae bacterium]HEV7956599.1 alpha/beta hydrolase [Marisediminicola sp.]
MVPDAGTLTVREVADGPPLSYWAFVPRSPEPAATLVLIHGSMRNTGRMFRAFLPAAASLNMPLIIPNFPTSGFPGYQRLAGARGPLAASTALDETLTDALLVFGISTAEFSICGFSGGAQFAHRYALFSPARINRLVVAAAGYYTYLDPSRPYPYGLGVGARLGDVRAEVDGFLRLPMHVLVGELDVEREAHLRVDPGLDRTQGNHRLARALRWVDHVEEVAADRGIRSQVSFDLLPGTAHSFSSAVHRGDLVTRVVSFVRSTPADDPGDSTNQSGKAA